MMDTYGVRQKRQECNRRCGSRTITFCNLLGCAPFLTWYTTMGKNALSSSGRRKKKNAGVKNRWQKRQESKVKQHMKSIVIENAEFLSKGQLKKVAKQPLNAIRASGKRKRKILKKLGHMEREKKKIDDKMDTQTEQKKKPKKEKIQNMDIDQTEDVNTDENNVVMDS